jgi:hypothetical protein
VLRTEPVEAQRESVLHTRKTLSIKRDHIDATLTFGLAQGGKQFMTVPSYDPGAHDVSTADDLRKLMLEADTRNVPLFGNIAQPELARQNDYKDVMKLLDNATLFTLVKSFPGLESQTTRYIYQYNPGSAHACDGSLNWTRLFVASIKQK